MHFTSEEALLLQTSQASGSGTIRTTIYIHILSNRMHSTWYSVLHFSAGLHCFYAGYGQHWRLLYCVFWCCFVVVVVIIGYFAHHAHNYLQRVSGFSTGNIVSILFINCICCALHYRLRSCISFRLTKERASSTAGHKCCTTRSMQHNIPQPVFLRGVPVVHAASYGWLVSWCLFDQHFTTW